MRDGVTTAVLSLGLIGSLLPSMSFPATMPAVVADLHLDASEAGWIGGIYFAGYAGAVPLLSSITDRVGAKPIYLLFSVVGAAAGLAFAIWAQSFWAALALRFLGGVALAGVHMPGLKLLTDLVGERAKSAAPGSTPRATRSVPRRLTSRPGMWRRPSAGPRSTPSRRRGRSSPGCSSPSCRGRRRGCGPRRRASRSSRC